VLVRAALPALVAAAVLAGTAAARPPTLAERAAVTAALPSFLRAVPAGCVWLDVALSPDGRWAKVTPRFLDATTLPCVKYASNGVFFLKRAARWKVVFDGSDLPPCALGVPKALARCRG
jgi:hypothetical protein